jgi:hypothetical protein
MLPSSQFEFDSPALMGGSQFAIIYYINVKSPNLDLKQGISYLERERGGGERERDREKERVRHKEREGERADNKNHGQRRVAQLVVL